MSTPTILGKGLPEIVEAILYDKLGFGKRGARLHVGREAEKIDELWGKGHSANEIAVILAHVEEAAGATLAVGTRVRVKDALADVSDYLWGHAGTVEDVRIQRDGEGLPYDEEETWGERHMVKFDEPIPGNMPRCRLKKRHLDIA